MTDAVMDKESFKNLLYLFLCPRLGHSNVPAANAAHRRIMTLAINTLTGKHLPTSYNLTLSSKLTPVPFLCIVNKANLVVQDEIGVLLVSSMPQLPLFLQRNIMLLVKKATKMASF